VLGFEKGKARSMKIKRGVVGGMMLHQCPSWEVQKIVLALKEEHSIVVAAQNSKKKRGS